MSEQNVFTSPYHDEPPALDNLSLTSYSLQNAYALGDKPAFIQDDKTINYNQLPSLVFRISRNLTAHGVQPNDVVLIHLPNNLYYGVIFHGVLVAGAITSTCNPTYNEEELEHQIKTSKSTVIVTLGLFLEKVKRTVANIPEVKKIFAVGDISPDFADVLPFSSLLAPVADEPEVIDIASFTPPGFDSRKQLAALPFSSGTTGLAKAVKLTHHNIAINTWQVAVSEREVTSSDTLIGILPLFHIYGLTLILNFSFLKGCTVVIMPRFDKNGFLDNIQKHKVTYLHIVPPIVLLLAKDPDVLKFDLSHVKCVFSGAAPLGQDLEKALKDRFPEIVVKQAYGMTELSPATAICPLSQPRPGSIGVLLPLIQARLISSETKLPVQVGEPGELLVKGPNVMVGYLDNDQATRETIDEDGWLHTGDVATVDADGFFTIVDRVKELIKYKGFQVPPAELEAILQKHQDVADAAVIGVADDEAGELPRAFVVLRAGATITPKELTDYCNSHLSHYKWIRAGLFPIPSIPRSSAGKILRKELRKLNVEQ